MINIYLVISIIRRCNSVLSDSYIFLFLKQKCVCLSQFCLSTLYHLPLSSFPFCSGIGDMSNSHFVSDGGNPGQIVSPSENYTETNKMNYSRSYSLLQDLLDLPVRVTVMFLDCTWKNPRHVSVLSSEIKKNIHQFSEDSKYFMLNEFNHSRDKYINSYCM